MIRYELTWYEMNCYELTWYEITVTPDFSILLSNHVHSVDNKNILEQGCYKDYLAIRDMVYTVDIAELVPSMCVRYCAKEGFLYAGVQVRGYVIAIVTSLSYRLRHSYRLRNNRVRRYSV